MQTKKYNEILIIFCIVLIALLYRRYDAFVRPQLWAEAFPIIFQQNETLGLKALITPYAGYLMTLPRIIAYIIGLFSVNYLYIPLCYNMSAFFVTFLVAVGLWDIANKLNIKHRILYATFFLFLPISSELFMDVASTQWMTALYLVNYIFAWNNKTDEKFYYLHLLILFIISVSGPFSTLASPVIVLMIIIEGKHTSMKRLFPLLVIMLGGTIQFICIKFVDPNFFRGVVGQQADHFHLLKLVTKNIGEILLMNSPLFPEVPDRVKTVSTLLIFIAFVYFFIKNYLKIENKRKYVLLLIGIIVFASFIQAYWPYESKVLSLENVRYYFVPYSCIVWLMIIAFDDKIKYTYIGLYVYFMLLHYHYMRIDLADKQWEKQIHEFYEGKRDVIDINPEGWRFPMYRKK